MTQKTVLNETHRRLGAKMVPFGGWDMPLSYPSGTLAEHRTCREAAVAFDVDGSGGGFGHALIFFLTGPGRSWRGPWCVRTRR